MSATPLSASDLIEIGKALEPIELLPAIVRNPLIGRIEVLRPGGGDVVGHFVIADEAASEDEAWFGFYAADPIVGEVRP
ncbi:hypothetical protein ACFVR6_03800 [Microbacterium sp. NPDC058021]|uniref:hypothetical protein n=1 Tax=Microbacterium sp. NPDC058021 TaxID=3346306 RepID=UPI0036DE6F2F